MRTGDVCRGDESHALDDGGLSPAERRVTTVLAPEQRWRFPEYGTAAWVRL